MTDLFGGVTARLAALVLDTPRWKFLTVLFLATFFRTGVTFVAPALLPIAQDPFHNPFQNPYEHYLFWSWLGPFLAHTVGATTAFTFTLFYLGFSIAFTALMVRWLFANLDEAAARTALVVFSLLPVSATSYYWVFTDSLTLFLLAAALYFPRAWPVVLVLGVGLGMQHFEQAAFGSAAALFALVWAGRRGVTRRYTWRWALALLVGAVIGKLVLVAIFHHHGIHVNSGRWFWLRKGWPIMLRRFAYSYHFAIFSAFGVGWLVVLRYLRRTGAEVRPVAVALFGLLLLLPISDDPTRVYAIVTFPVLCLFFLDDRDFLASFDRAALGTLVLLWILVPFMFVWSGKPIVSAAAYDLYKGIHHLFHTRYSPVDPRFPY